MNELHTSKTRIFRGYSINPDNSHQANDVDFLVRPSFPSPLERDIRSTSRSQRSKLVLRRLANRMCTRQEYRNSHRMSIIRRHRWISLYHPRSWRCCRSLPYRNARKSNLHLEYGSIDWSCYRSDCWWFLGRRG